jgi:hypothetical protein
VNEEMPKSWETTPIKRIIRCYGEKLPSGAMVVYLPKHFFMRGVMVLPDSVKRKRPLKNPRKRKPKSFYCG